MSKLFEGWEKRRIVTFLILSAIIIILCFIPAFSTNIVLTALALGIFIGLMVGLFVAGIALGH